MTQYELEAPWQPIETVPIDRHVNVFYADGSTGCSRIGPLPYKGLAIAWCPIVPPKVKRWRAECGKKYYYVYDGGGIDDVTEAGDGVDGVRHAIGNYYRTREEAEAAAVRVKNAYQGGE